MAKKETTKIGAVRKHLNLGDPKKIVAAAEKELGLPGDSISTQLVYNARAEGRPAGKKNASRKKIAKKKTSRRNAKKKTPKKSAKKSAKKAKRKYTKKKATRRTSKRGGRGTQDTVTVGGLNAAAGFIGDAGDTKTAREQLDMVIQFIETAGGVDEAVALMDAVDSVQIAD